MVLKIVARHQDTGSSAPFFLAESDVNSTAWRKNYIQTHYLSENTKETLN
jgi:hypothetical protein